jgi:hypothetical protein
MTVALAAAQVLPALVGAVLGVFPGGFALFAAIIAVTGGSGDRAMLPSFWQMSAVVVATALVVGVLTAVPARLGGRVSLSRGPARLSGVDPATSAFAGFFHESEGSRQRSKPS